MDTGSPMRRSSLKNNRYFNVVFQVKKRIMSSQAYKYNGTEDKEKGLPSIVRAASVSRIHTPKFRRPKDC